MIIKGWCNGIPVTVERFPSLVGFEPKTATIRGPAPNLPCKIIASISKDFTSFLECCRHLIAKLLTYQILKKVLFKKKEKSSFRIEEDGRTLTRNPV